MLTTKRRVEGCVFYVPSILGAESIRQKYLPLAAYKHWSNCVRKYKSNGIDLQLTLVTKN